MQYKTPRELFVEKHGTDYEQDGDFYLFSDGAKMEGSSYGLLKEPPTDAFELADLKVRFHELRLARAKAAFDKRIHHWREVANAVANGCSLCMDEETVKRELEPLREKVLLAQQQLKEAELVRDQVPAPAWYTRWKERKTELGEAQQKASDFKTMLDRLRV